MSLLESIGLVVVATLVAFLYQRIEERIRRGLTRNSQTGSSFDATQLCQRVQRVRRDYLAVIVARSRDRQRRKQLHAQYGRTVRCRSYFCRKAMDRLPLTSEAEQRFASGD